MVEKFEKDLNWVLSVLKSCETLEQLQVAQNCHNQLLNKWNKSVTSDEFSLLSWIFDGEILFEKGVEEVKTKIFKKNIDNLPKN